MCHPCLHRAPHTTEQVHSQNIKPPNGNFLLCAGVTKAGEWIMELRETTRILINPEKQINSFRWIHESIVAGGAVRLYSQKCGSEFIFRAKEFNLFEFNNYSKIIFSDIKNSLWIMIAARVSQRVDIYLFFIPSRKKAQFVNNANNE